MKKSKAVSTRNLSVLPEIESLRRRLQQMSALAAVFAIKYGTSEFEFYPKWKKAEQMGAFKNGCGDELFMHFTPAGCFIKGFAHESVMSPFQKTPPALWPGLLSSVPAVFESSMKEPAFEISATTFVVWRLANDQQWHTDNIKFPDRYSDDGSPDLLSKLTMTASEFAEWLEENYEAEVDAEIVSHVFDNRPMTKAQLGKLNPSVAVTKLRDAVLATGYAVD